MNLFRDSVYTKAQTLAGNKTLSGNTAVGGTLGVTGATTLTGNLTANGTTASFPNATAVTFPNANPTVKAKSAAAVLGNTTQLATEAQVALAQNTAVNTAHSTMHAFRDPVYTKTQNITGDKTFTGTITMPVPQLPITTTAKTFFAAPTAANGRPTFRPIAYADIPAIERANRLAFGGTDSVTLAGLNTFKTNTESNAQTLAGVKTFTSAPVVPQKSATITASNATTAAAVATEAQVYLTAQAQALAADPTKLQTFRDSVYNKTMTLNGVKTFASAPLVPAKSAALTAATDTTALATEAQIYNTALNAVPTALWNFRDSTYLRNQTLAGIKTFTSAPVVPAKTNSGNSSTALAMDAAVNAVRDSLLHQAQTYADNKTFEKDVTVLAAGTTTLNGTTTLAGATTVRGAAKFTSATATKFVNASPTVPAKTTAITTNTATTALATEAQVFNSVKSLTNAFRDSVYGKAQTLNGQKTFDKVPILPSQTKNHVFAAPSTGNGAPTFRALVKEDIPDNLNQNTTG
ncbi:hypothetical protein AGMMS49525_17290 [Bacteroidia bacterium]|nr:hypothetical protein AGMMS49525_17290 [Bacteroidia bacterium]